MSGSIPVSALKKRSDFLRVARGRKVATQGLVLQMCRTPGQERTDGVRLGLTASRKIGTAVERNRARRRLRAAARRVLPLSGQSGNDYVLIARKATLSRTFAALIEDLEMALTRVHGARPTHRSSKGRRGPGSEDQRVKTA